MDRLIRLDQGSGGGSEHGRRVGDTYSHGRKNRSPRAALGAGDGDLRITGRPKPLGHLAPELRADVAPELHERQRVGRPDRPDLEAVRHAFRLGPPSVPHLIQTHQPGSGAFVVPRLLAGEHLEPEVTAALHPPDSTAEGAGYERLRVFVVGHQKRQSLAAAARRRGFGPGRRTQRG
jgi:hypothetical protein